MKPNDIVWLGTARDPGEKQMGDRIEDTTEVTARRGFFAASRPRRRSACSALQPPRRAPSRRRRMARIGRERSTAAISRCSTSTPSTTDFRSASPTTSSRRTKSATAVMIFRHQGLPYALNSAMWAKYKVGETFKIIDPETKAPAVKNPYFEPKPGVLGNPECRSRPADRQGHGDGRLRCCIAGPEPPRWPRNAGVTPDEAFKEFAANLLPGVTVLPSGTWGVNRAQEAGCTYCAGG